MEVKKARFAAISAFKGEEEAIEFMRQAGLKTPKWKLEEKPAVGTVLKRRFKE